MRRRWITVAAAVLVLGAIAVLAVLKPRGGNLEPRQIVTGKALIGGPFTLTDHTGKRVTESDFAGKLTLVFFGYTSCPDICPASQQVISAVLDQLGGKARDVIPLFITIDPERDDVKKLASYVSNFHERMVGLTGSPEEIRAVAKAYRIFYERQESDTPGDGYAMDHSSVVYLMSRSGEYLAHFSYGTGVAKMVAGITKFL